jgi:hypothetical protein
LILVKTALDKLVADERQKVAAVGKALATDAVIFTQDTASNAAVVASVEGGGGYFSKTTADIAPSKDANISAAAPKTVLIANFKQNLPISRTFMDDQQQSAVSKAVRQRYKAWIASQQRNAFYVYAQGFAGSTSNSTTIDGVPLFSNSHINQNGDTVDNYETGVISDSNLNTLVVSLRGQVDQGGTKIGYEPDFLLTSSLNDHDCRIVAKSVLRAGTGNNDLNYYSEMYPGMQVKFNQFIDDISTTSYFIGTSGHDVYRYEREAFFTTLVPWQTNDDDLYKYKMRAREEVDALAYVGVAGSDGTVSS